MAKKKYFLLDNFEIDEDDDHEEQENEKKILARGRLSKDLSILKLHQMKEHRLVSHSFQNLYFISFVVFW